MTVNFTTRIAGCDFRWGERTYVMGIINVTPDSFSGDGLSGVESAFSQAQRMIGDGADILDIGGESTKPGFTPVDEKEEIRRVVSVIKYIVPRINIPVSIDSCKYEVVRQALEAGASIINDQWGLKSEPRLAALAARYSVPIILMSNQRDKGGFDAVNNRDTGCSDDIVRDVLDGLRQSILIATSNSVPEHHIIVDPGLGFGKTWKDDLEIIRRLDALQVLNVPLLLGPSRKSFIKMVLALPPAERIEGTAAAVAVGITRGVDIVRVHDVKEIARVCRVTDAIMRSTNASCLVNKEK